PAEARDRHVVFDEVRHKRLDQRLAIEAEERRQQRPCFLDVVGLADPDAAAEMHRLDDAREDDIGLAHPVLERTGCGPARFRAHNGTARPSPPLSVVCLSPTPPPAPGSAAGNGGFRPPQRARGPARPPRRPRKPPAPPRQPRPAAGAKTPPFCALLPAPPLRR